jgi:hypothetical protein
MEIGRPYGGDDRAEMTDEQIGQTQASVAAASQRFIAHEVLRSGRAAVVQQVEAGGAPLITSVKNDVTAGTAFNAISP